MEDYMNRMYDDYSAFFIGAEGSGKTELAKYLAMIFTAGKGKQYKCLQKYVCTDLMRFL